jgi:hypothetical protein
MKVKGTARCLSVVALATVAFASAVQAQTPAPYAPPPPGYAAPGYAPPPSYGYPAPGYAVPPAAYARKKGFETHDGVYVRLHFGLGYSEMSASNANGGQQLAKLSGDTVSFGVAVGGALTENLILYGTLQTDALASPTLQGGFPGGVAAIQGMDDTGLGVGVAYYVEPANLYVSGAILASQIEVDGQDARITQTNFGPGFQGIVGKEWWVSDNWGLGLAAEFVYARMKDSKDVFLIGGPANWSATAFTVLFSATFN